MHWGFERDGLDISNARENCKLQIARTIESISVTQLARLCHFLFFFLISQIYHDKQFHKFAILSSRM